MNYNTKTLLMGLGIAIGIWMLGMLALLLMNEKVNGPSYAIGYVSGAITCSWLTGCLICGHLQSTTEPPSSPSSEQS